MTQGQILLQACRRKEMTYGDLQALGISTSPHKRLVEAAARYLKPFETLRRRVNKAGLIAFKVVRG